MAGTGNSGAPPTSRNLTASDIASCCRVPAHRRATWARNGRLKAAGPWTSHDVVETAIAFSIPEGVHATAVWDVIQPGVRKLILAGKDEQIWLVVPQIGGQHHAVAGAAAAARAADHLGVFCLTHDTRAAVAEAMKRFAIKVGQQAPAVVTPLRQSRRGSHSP